MPIPTFDPEMKVKATKIMSTVVGKKVAKHLMDKEKVLNERIATTKNIVDKSLAIGEHRAIIGIIKLVILEAEKIS